MQPREPFYTKGNSLYFFFYPQKIQIYIMSSQKKCISWIQCHAHASSLLHCTRRDTNPADVINGLFDVLYLPRCVAAAMQCITREVSPRIIEREQKAIYNCTLDNLALSSRWHGAAVTLLSGSRSSERGKYQLKLPLSACKIKREREREIDGEQELA